VKWYLITHDFFTGKYNMGYDLQLVKQAEPDSAFLRFYGWKPYCISLGANQSISEIKTEKATSDNIDIVKRPTGGRAILHAEELTYSVVLPNIQTISGREVYENISNAIVAGLHLFDSELNDVILENEQPMFKKLLEQPSGALCFASTAKSEIKFKGKKLVGSAQRRIGNSLLQHGSILIGRYHQHLVEYLNIESEDELLNLSTELNNKTIEIETILNKKIILSDLQDSIIEGFKNYLNIELNNLLTQSSF
jgi:lipoate-protein ligase A